MSDVNDEELINQNMSYNSEDEQSDSGVEKIEVPVGSKLTEIDCGVFLNMLN